LLLNEGKVDGLISHSTSAEAIKKTIKEKEGKFGAGKKTNKNFHTFPSKWNAEISFRDLLQLEYFS
jgi:hypothetical protein